MEDDLTALIARARGGDLDAFGKIVRLFQDMAFGFAGSVLGDFHLAEDVAQEAFIEAYSQLPSLREPEAFAGWFRRIVYKHCDRVVRRKSVRTVALDAAAETAADDAGPAQIVEQREMQDKVLEAIRSLPEHQRMVTTLFYIDGYSQKEIGDFLEVPVTTVKKRLHDSRQKLKERMIDMVRETLREKVPDERFSQKVIAELLARPRPLAIEGHPVRQVWDQIRAALPDYEVVLGDEVVDKELFQAVQEDMDRAYHVDDDRALRTQMSITTLREIQGRTAPVRLLAPGRVFRPAPEDAAHQKVFHQADGVCIEPGADREQLKATLERVLNGVFGAVELRWRDHGFGFVEDGLEVDARWRDQWLEVCGSGVLSEDALRDAGYDPDAVGGYAFGLGLERLAMLKLGIEDIRELWQPPYVTGEA